MKETLRESLDEIDAYRTFTDIFLAVAVVFSLAIF